MNPEFALTLRECNLVQETLDTSGGPAVRSSPCPPDYKKKIVLRDGTRATIRPILSEDKSSLLSFHRSLSEETRFLRYHYSKGDLTESDLKMFCDVDYQATLGLVTEIDREGVRRIIGVGRYSRLPFDHTAEVAFVVHDNEQNKGIGSHLLKHLAILAWQQGIYFFFGEVLRQNGHMLSIFRKSDPHMKQEIDGATTCNVTVSVVEAMRRAL
jgi:GNAT superfamily N-acetyltransferase